MIAPYLISTNHQRILRFFLFHPDSAFYEREISRRADISPSSTNCALNQLYRAGLLHRRRSGRMCFYSLDKSNPYLKQFKILCNLLAIEPLVELLKPHSHKAAVFGSWADGSDAEGSDIDIFVVTSDKEKVLSIIDKFSYSAKVEGRKIQPIIKHPRELLKPTSTDTVFLEEVEHGRILWEKEIREHIL